jgi:hypothetical protein
MLTGIFQPPWRILQPKDDMRKSVFCQSTESSEFDMIDFGDYVAITTCPAELVLK